MAMPSTIYLLLGNPAWATNGDYKTIRAGLEGEWKFDPNETHDGIPLLGRLIERWFAARHSEEDLLPLVEALLDRGAEPGAAHDSITMGVMDYTLYKGLAYLMSRHYQSEIVPHVPTETRLAARLLSVHANTIGITECVKRFEELLEPHAGWETPIDGLKVAPLLALTATHDDRTLCWSAPMDTSSARRVQAMRVLAQVATKSQKQLGLLDRFVVGCGMLHLAAICRDHAGERAASDALEASALKLIGERPEAWVGLLALAMEQGAVPPSLRGRLGQAVMRGLATTDMQPEVCWDIVRQGLPLLFTDQRFTGNANTLSILLHPSRGLPGEEFWAMLPVNDHTHEGLMRLLVGSYCQSSYEWRGHGALRVEFLDRMVAWSQGGDLSPLDINQCIQGVHRDLLNDGAMMQRLRGYNEQVRSLRQEKCLHEGTPAAAHVASRPRL